MQKAIESPFFPITHLLWFHLTQKEIGLSMETSWSISLFQTLFPRGRENGWDRPILITLFENSSKACW